MKRLAWSILMLLPLGAMAAEIYRSVDENGVVVYSDRPSLNAELIVLNAPGRSSSPRRVDRGVVADDAAEDADGASENEPEGPVFAEVPREVTPEERASNCEIAREKATTYNSARRLFRAGPDGERIYLTDAELDEARATAESEVATWCD